MFKKIHNNMVKMQPKFTIYQNKKQKTMFQLKKNTSVNEKSENKKNQQQIKSCENWFVFHQTTKKSINYKLNLFFNIKIHWIFYVLLLKLANSKTFIQNTFHFQYETNDKYKIEKFLQQNNQRYFVK